MKSKVVPGIAFVLLLRFLGLFLGIILGALVVPEGSGLAGPGIVFGYGIVSGGIAVVLGSMLARTLAYAQLRTALVGTGVSALLACAGGSPIDILRFNSPRALGRSLRWVNLRS